MDHANSSQHKASTTYLKADQAKAKNEPVTSFSPVARCLMNMDAATKERKKCKFDICYVMAKEGMAFSKYPALYDLESRHDVDLGIAYKNDVSAKSFTHYIAQSQREHFLRSLSNSHYSFLMDGTTDSGKVEDEVVRSQSFISLPRFMFVSAVVSEIRELNLNNKEEKYENG